MSIDDILESNAPKHIAIIMDGNSRWAKGRGLPKIEGHRKGAEALRGLLKPCMDMGIECLSVYAFSQENWGRPADEVSDLMGLLDFYIRRETKTLIKHGIKLHVSGDLSKVKQSTRNALEGAVAQTAGGNKLILNICFSYGGRQELVNAMRIIAAQMMAKNPTIETIATEITEEIIASALYTAILPDPDLLIRTGGEHRISNFLLWQIAYTELYFTDILWPDFDEAALRIAINDFNSRERRYGKR